MDSKENRSRWRCERADTPGPVQSDFREKAPLAAAANMYLGPDGNVVKGLSTNGQLGTPGGSRIITAVLHTIINVIDYDMTIQEAVDAPRFHQQWLPETTNVETNDPRRRTGLALGY